jgi:putative ABC transport system ATP-binding protein
VSDERRQGGDPVLEVRGLAKSYHDGRTEHAVLRDVELRVARGECLALLGRSGSGKSTLLNLLAGIDRPDRGEVRILGEPVSRLDEPALTLFRRRHIGFIYQLFNLVPTLTVAENLALPLELNGIEGPPKRDRVAELLRRVGLADRGGSFPDQLSGGEQQRVAIARALAHDPALVLADEPTGNLDAHTGEQVLTLLTELFREQGRTLILVTHSLAVSRIAHRVLSIDEGRLSEGSGQLSW